MGSENPGWLPEGWTVDVKARNYGRKDKYYIDPSKGLKFSSKAEVLRHLQSAAKAYELKELNKNAGKKADEQELPPGWIKEVKTTKRGGKIRKDPVYTNPVSGHQFRSIQEVFRHLETEDSQKDESKSIDKDCNSVKLEHNSQTSPAEAKKPLVNKQADKMFPGQNSGNSEMELTGGSNGDIVNNVAIPKQSVNRAERYTNKMQKRPGAVALKEADLRKETPAEKMHREDDSNVGDLPNRIQKLEESGIPNKGQVDRQLENDVRIKQSLQSGSKTDAETKLDAPEANGPENREAENCSVGDDEKHDNAVPRSNKRKKSNAKEATIDLPRRTSKRLARVEVETSPEVKPSNQSHSAELNTAEANVQTILKLSELDLNMNEKLDESREETNEPPKNLVKENPTSNNQETEPVTSSKILDFEGNKVLENILMDPCIEFAFKTLTGEIPIEEVKKVVQNPLPSFLPQMPIEEVKKVSASASASTSAALASPADIWSDPSFEFAVKMLTCEMPAEPTFRFDNRNHPSSLSFGRVDVGRKFFVSQQGAIPHGVNGSSAGVYGYHHPSQWR